MKVKYIIYNPAGNITALVIGDKYSKKDKKIINNNIMKINPEIEQVGFLSLKKAKLTMAGGEFCGNATRCAAKYYIEKNQTEKIRINNKKLKIGMDENQNYWCEIPIKGYKFAKLSDNVYKIKFDEISIIGINIEKTCCCSESCLKKKAKELISKYKLNDKAVGVMFVEKKKELLKIYPVVWVKSIDTLFLENACGSGSVGVTMIDAILNNKEGKYLVYQPSGEYLETRIQLKNNKVKRAILNGKILTDNKILEIEV